MVHRSWQCLTCSFEQQQRKCEVKRKDVFRCLSWNLCKRWTTPDCRIHRDKMCCINCMSLWLAEQQERKKQSTVYVSNCPHPRHWLVSTHLSFYFVHRVKGVKKKPLYARKRNINFTPGNSYHNNVNGNWCYLLVFWMHGKHQKEQEKFLVRENLILLDLAVFHFKKLHSFKRILHGIH